MEYSYKISIFVAQKKKSSMKKLLSLPPNLVECFHDLENVDRTEWFCTSDPVGRKLGSGGGTAWLLEACRQEWSPELSLHDWLGQEKRILGLQRDGHD